MIYEPGFYKSDTMFDGSPYYIQILKSYSNGICDYLIKTPGYGIRLKHDNILYRLEINKMDFNNYKFKKKYAELSIKTTFTDEMEFW